MKATHSTKPVSEKDIKRNWHLIDVKGKVLGRVATQIAKLLQGKGKTDYVPYLDCGDNVVVVNVQSIVVTGQKSNDKTYNHYSGYPGGLRTFSYADLMQTNPGKIIENAVSGMLPKNTFRSDRLRRLFIFKDENHTFKDKFKKS